MDCIGERIRKADELGGYWWSKNCSALDYHLIGRNVKICLDMEYVLKIKLIVLTETLNMGYDKRIIKAPRYWPDN